ncbi:hypothetical protein PVL29_007615 [Vitis rotundifolia]|uniref:Uncharacterized protein n=1 Tax=Vitis rotundifolia TaxID=103349 RepID=A0AA39DV03_VITRO|nr:hypothetical protein PVL29_007615 [Vitis rotundifolia]
MAGGGGFGGFGGLGGGFGCGNFQSHHPVYRPSPPLTAIDRFLVGQSHFSQRQTQNSERNSGDVVSSNGFHDFCSASGAIGSIGKGLNLKEKKSPEVVQSGEEKVAKRSSRASGKREKGGFSATLIKGQWSAEEDRQLLRLVNEFGEKKWAQIAKKLGGRAGKQCRERWHNHLRPDIRKDEWDEEEERILIEWHKKVGNKWAEIAKRITGRTENTIKNHFNATKRRQDSRKKSNKDDQKPQSTLLQVYIKSKKLDDKWTTTTTTQNATATPTSSTISEDPPTTHYKAFLQDFSESTVHDSPSLMTQTCDEELLFMQNLFPSDCGNPPFAGTSENISSKGVEEQDDMALDSFDLFQTSGSAECGSTSIQGNASSTHLHSDIYISNLLNGTSTPSSASIDHCYSYNINPMNVEFLTDPPSSSSGKREMDLIEMLSCSRFCNQGTHTNL